MVRSELCAWTDWAFQGTLNLDDALHRRMHSSHGMQIKEL